MRVVVFNNQIDTLNACKDLSGLFLTKLFIPAKFEIK